VLIEGRGDGFQIWRVAVNILNKKSGQPTGGGAAEWRFGEGLTTTDCKKPGCYGVLQRIY
jgi:hypothetical protein